MVSWEGSLHRIVSLKFSFVNIPKSLLQKDHLTVFPQTQNTEEATRKCADITDRLLLLEQEVGRNREDSRKSKAEVERLMLALREAEMEKLSKEKKIADLERWGSQNLGLAHIYQKTLRGRAKGTAFLKEPDSSVLFMKK